MKENVFNPDEMAIIINALIYTHVRKLKAYNKAQQAWLDGVVSAERKDQLHKQAAETLALIQQISDSTDSETRDFIHEQLKLALA